MSEGGRIEPGHRTASPAEITAVRARVARARHPLGYVTELDGTEITGRALPRPGTEVAARPEVVPPDEPDADLKCAATDYGYYCIARRGHPAWTLHAAWGVPADAELCHTWPQEFPPQPPRRPALTPQEAETLEVARLVTRDGRPATRFLVASLAAIIGRLTGTAGGQP